MKPNDNTLRNGRRSGPLALLCAFSLSACGDDEGGSAPPPPAAVGRGGTAAKPAAAATKSGESLDTYRKIEMLVDGDEAKTIRHQFKERDFSSDPNLENRDPYRSFVGGGIGEGAGSQAQLRDTEQCRKDRQIATNFGVRDLRLSAILAAGTQRHAMFQDSTDYGHFVMRGDCVGKEKARVVEVGAGFVRFEFLPEVAPGQPPRASETFDVQLFPDEVQTNVTEGGGL
ncbi:MAG: hypothetical protein IPL79_18800 [Myxococcales bacterium]|nr:hypothetical protein [Myxococcales bacterium]